MEYDNPKDCRAFYPGAGSVGCAGTSTKSRAAERDDFHPDARFARIVLPYLGEAYVLARVLTGNGTDAEDVVQEASLSAYRAIASFANGNARHWVLTIVRHCGYQWLRKNRRSSVIHVRDLEAVEDARTPETELIAKINAEQLSAAIGAIPEPFRETLILRVTHDLNYREIAEVMQVPVGTVMSRLARARHYLIAVTGAAFDNADRAAQPKP
jgi:RNA polymerase sigma-70 factor (ECF subfamily)